MAWLVFAFSGPVLWAASTHIDKYLVDKYFKTSNVAVLLIFTAAIGLLTLPFIWLFAAGVAGFGFEDAALTALAGALYMGGMYFYLQALQSEDASTVAPFYQAAPLFGYALGYLVLGETLSAEQLGGGALIIVGTILVSLRSGHWKGSVKPHLVGLMLACALSLAVSSLIFKIFALREEFWPTTFWMYLGEALFGGALFAAAPIRQQFVGLLKSSPGAVLSVNTVNELINLAGSLGTRYALMLAPLSLVQAIGSTTALFVFAFGAFISIVWPSPDSEELSLTDLLRKGMAAIAVAFGAFLISQ